MDGVLIDSEPLWKIAMEDVFASLGSKLLKNDFEKTVGLRIDEVIHFWNKHENWGVEDENQIADVEEYVVSSENVDTREKRAATELLNQYK